MPLSCNGERNCDAFNLISSAICNTESNERFPTSHLTSATIFICLDAIDGSTDRCSIAIVSNQRALLCGKTNLQRSPHLHNGIWCIDNIGNGYELETITKVKLTEIYRQCTASQRRSGEFIKCGRRLQNACPRFIIRSIVVMEAIT